MNKSLYPVLIVLSCFLYSCREKQATKYSTNALECLSALTSSDNLGSQETQDFLDKYKNEFSFAADLQELILTEKSLKDAQILIVKGKIIEAREIIDQRIIELGYSKELDESLKSLDAALMLQRYIESKGEVDEEEEVREFSSMKANSIVPFSKSGLYRNWLKLEKKRIYTLAANRKKYLRSSLMSILDYSSVVDAGLVDIILLETAAHEETLVLPGEPDGVSRSISESLKNRGIASVRREHLAVKSFAKLRKNGQATLIEELQLIKYHAKQGATSRVLADLQEMDEVCGLKSEIRQQILKQLFVAKGWNKSSLINRDMLDLSVLLETIYKTNN